METELADDYVYQHSLALATVEDIAEALADLPAPSDQTNWAHVGDIARIARLLAEVLDTIQSGGPE